MFKAKIIVSLRSSILDPQGKAVHQALGSLGMYSVRDVRIGKYIEMLIDESDFNSANHIAEESCKKLLANPVMEDFQYTLEEI